METLLGGNGYVAAGAYPDSYSYGGDAVSTESYDPQGAMQVLERPAGRMRDGDGVREKDGQELTLRWLTYPQPSGAAAPGGSSSGHAGRDRVLTCRSIILRIITVSARTEAPGIFMSAHLFTAPLGDPEYFFNYCCLDGSVQNVGNYQMQPPAGAGRGIITDL